MRSPLDPSVSRSRLEDAFKVLFFEDAVNLKRTHSTGRENQRSQVGIKLSVGVEE